MSGVATNNLPSLPILAPITCNCISLPSQLLICTRHSISHPPVTPHPSLPIHHSPPVTPLPSLLTHHSPPITPHPSLPLITPHHSLPPITPPITPCPSLPTHHSLPITPQPSLPTCHSSPIPPHPSTSPITPHPSLHPSLPTHHSPSSLSTTLQKCEKRPREGLLTNELKYSVKYLNQFLPPEHNMRYIHIDMARINKR